MKARTCDDSNREEGPMSVAAERDVASDDNAARRVHRFSARL